MNSVYTYNIVCSICEVRIDTAETKVFPQYLDEEIFLLLKMNIYPTLLMSVICGIVHATHVCHVPPIFRQECGWGGILAETCKARGCCFDSSIEGAKWCFKKANLTGKEKENFTLRSTVIQTDPLIQNNCIRIPNDRRQCGWTGISRETCEGKGCCFNSNTPETIWCFHKRNH